MTFVHCVFTAVFSLAFAGSAQQSRVRNVYIGTVGEYRVTVEDIEIRRKDLSVTKPAAGRPFWLVACDEDKSVIREGEKRTWIIRYSAWKADDYDLRDLLAWSSGLKREMVKPMIVTVIDPLPAGNGGKLVPAPKKALDIPLPPTDSWRWAVVVIWSLGFVGLAQLAWFKRDQIIGAIGLQGDAARRRVLDGMRAGSRGPLTPQTRAELQRQFLGLLLRDFEAAEGSMREMLLRLQEHAEGGPLLAQFDEWQESAAVRATRLPEGVIHYLVGTAAASGGK